jgi:uncharacterized short protein YbdD (DUF466 family)
MKKEKKKKKHRKHKHDDEMPMTEEEINRLLAMDPNKL